MNIYAVGVNHQTAPIEIRDRLFLTPEETLRALREVKRELLREAVIISTCNRTELYGVPYNDGIDGVALQHFLLGVKPEAGVEARHVFRLFTCSAANHMLKVAGGVDSLVVGDVQILGQVKEAYELSVQAGSSGTVMHHLLHTALHTGKRIRSETTLGIGAISISYAAVELAKKIFDDLHRKNVLLIGLGETGTLTARHLLDKGVEHLLFANRTRERAEERAGEFGARVVDYEAVPSALHEADIVIAATSADRYIVDPPMIRQAMKRRHNNPLLVIDIGTPRNIDPRVNDIANVFLKDIDSLQSIVDQNLERRREEIPKAQMIIAEELTSFFIWFNALEATPTIMQLREKFELIRTAELARYRNRIDDGSIDIVELLTKRIINKLLHPTMVSLRAPAGNGTYLETKVRLLRELFALDEEGEKEEPSPPRSE